MEIPVPDCECGVGLTRAYFTTNQITGGVSLSIVLSNGQTITSPPLNSIIPPVILFRVLGNTLQYQVNNGAWTTIYTFPFNQSDPTNNTSTTTVQQVLNAIDVPGGTILNPGDVVNGKIIVSANATSGNPASNGQLVGATIFGTALPNITLANGAAKTTLSYTATMSLNSNGQTVAVINGSAVMSAAPVDGLETVLGSFTIPQFSTGVVDFTATQQIQATGTSITTGDLTQQYISASLSKASLPPTLAQVQNQVLNIIQ